MLTLLTADERAALDAVLGTTSAAPALAVADTVTAAAGAARHGYTDTAKGRVLASDVVALAARLVAVEQVLDTTRRTLARVAASDFHLTVPDLLWELEKAGVGITADELDEAEALAEAEAAAEALR
ncbi:hypothetical protein QEN62_gp38 [Streptomyces phage AxeJC]|uniref:Uncharacterized protein n=1 Tax=Streptomyces phage AxeJC TaxID=2926084 RepID=A0A9E7J7E7_9CAUD|nr:hypothetical protein QEN62_gp38 [Streptomyces phage AxeJC]URC17960.1 hypothetical protein SEA_AXEJC_38 [Streptomyces phage AxeJC]